MSHLSENLECGCSPPAIQEPVQFRFEIQDAYFKAVACAGHGYYFTCDEIIAMADAAGADTTIVQIEDNKYQAIARSKWRAQPSAMVGIRPGKSSSFRSHFERLCPLPWAAEKVLASYGCPLPSKVSDCWYLLKKELAGHATPTTLTRIWNFSIVPGRSTASALKYTIDTHWQRAWDETPWFAKIDEQESRQRWFASTFIQSWNGIDLHNTIDQNRGAKRRAGEMKPVLKS